MKKESLLKSFMSFLLLVQPITPVIASADTILNDKTSGDEPVTTNTTSSTTNASANVTTSAKEAVQDSLALSLKETNKKIGVGETFFIKIKGSSAKAELVLPKGLTYEESKNKKIEANKQVSYDQEKRTLNIKSLSTDQEALEVNLTAEKAGSYELQLMNEDQTVKSEKLQVTVEQSKVTSAKMGKSLRSINEQDARISLTIDSTPETNFTSNDNRILYSLLITHTNAMDTISNGQITVTLENGIFNTSPNKDETPELKNVTISSDRKTATFTLNNGIASGNFTTLNFTVIPEIGIASQSTIKATAEFTGKFSSETDTFKNTVSKEITYDVGEVDTVIPVVPNSTAWSVNGLKDIQSYPGQLIGQYLTLRRNGQASPKEGFKNLKVRVVVSDPAVIQQNMLEGFQASYEKELVSGGKEYINFDKNTDISYPADNICEVKVGPVNPVIDNTVIIKNSFRFPKGTPAGTKYTWHTEFYDGDTLIYRTNEGSATAIAEGTTITGLYFNNGNKAREVHAGDLQSVSLKYSLASSGNATNMQTVFDIPDKVNLQYLQPLISSGANSSSQVKSVEYLVNGTWETATYEDVYKFPSGANITKVRVNLKDTKALDTLQPLRLVFQVKDSLNTGDTFRVKLDSFTYKDAVGADQSLPVNNYYTDYTVTDAEKYSKAAVNQVNQTVDFDSGPAVPGDQFQMNYRIGVDAGELEQPYIFVKVPKGLEVKNDVNVIQYPFGGYIEYKQAPADGVEAYPINKANNVGKFEMSDGKYEVYYYKADDTVFHKLDSLMMLLIQNTYTVKELSAGVYDIQVGMGSLTKAPNDAMLLAGYQTSTLSAELKTKLGAENSTFYTKTTQLKVGSLDKVSTNVSVKGSEDTNWIDASNGGIGTVIPGRKVSYKIELKNEGTKDYTDVQLINILPYINDTLVSSNAPRNSQFQINPDSAGFKIKYNGVESDNVVMEYSTSNNPERFSSPDGTPIPGDSWTSTPGDISKVRSLKVSLPGVTLKPNDVITIEYSGTIATDAARPENTNQVLTANNSVAYKFKTSTGEIRAGEPAVSKVKTVPAENNGLISGTVFDDLNKNGSQESNEPDLNKVKFELYKRNASGEFVATGETTESSSNSTGANGTFAFVDLEYGTYRVKVLCPEAAGSELITSGTYGIQSINAQSGWVTFNGSPDFVLSDISSTSNAVTGIKVPVFVYTPLSGKVIFKNKDGEVLSKNYGQNFEVILKDKTGAHEIARTHTKADSSYEFENLAITSTDEYQLTFVVPTGKHFTFTQDNPTGTIKTQIVPGNGATGKTDVYITDIDKPTGTIELVGGAGDDHNANPTQAVITASDQTTDPTIAWTILDADNNPIYQGTTTEIESELSYLLNDKHYGVYKIEAVITDAAGNTNTGKLEKTFIITELPVLTVEEESLTYQTIDILNEEKFLTDAGVSATIADPNQHVVITTDFADVISDTKVAGTYVVTVKATNDYGVSVSKQVTVTIKDTEFPVTYVVDGNETQAVGNYNKLLTKPTDPNKAGYTFDGWLKADGETFWNFSTDKMPAEAVRLTAAFTAQDQTITFDVNGGDESSKPANIVKPTGTEVNLTEVTAPSRSGYTFTGWYNGNTKVTGTIQMPAGGLNLVAHWTADDQTITFDVNGGDAASKPADIVQPTDSEVNIDAVTKPTRGGYQFVNWINTVDNSVVSGTIQMPVGGLNLKATWTAADQVLAFDTNGGTGIASVALPTDATFDLSTVSTTRAGYEFAGWFKGDQEYSGEITIPAGGLTLKAKWTALDQTITFDVNGGDAASKPADIVQPTDSEVDIDAITQPTRAGYEFTGWYDGNTQVSGTISMPVGGLTLTAHWKAVKQTITFDVNGGDPATTPAVIEAATDSVINLDEVAIPEREAFEFMGWADSEGNPVSGEYTVPAGGARFVAQWKDLILSGDWVLEGKDVKLGLSEYKKLAQGNALDAMLRQLADIHVVDKRTGETVIDSSRILLDMTKIQTKVGQYTMGFSFTPKTYPNALVQLFRGVVLSAAPTSEATVSTLSKEVMVTLYDDTPAKKDPVTPVKPDKQTPAKNVSSKVTNVISRKATVNPRKTNQRLAQTGEKNNRSYLVVGILCVIVALGGFVFFKRKDQEIKK